jgi:predicted aconitase with swiveling domain
MLREMAQSGIAPLGYVFNSVNPILAQGAAFGETPMVDRFDDGDVTTLIATGDLINVDPARGVVTILEPIMDPTSGISY